MKMCRIVTGFRRGKFGVFQFLSYQPCTTFEDWVGLKCVVMVVRTRHLWNKATHQVQFYLTSLARDAHKLGQAIRLHWGIENGLHWTLDVTFKEDDCRVRTGHAPQNLALLRRMGLNALNP